MEVFKPMFAGDILEMRVQRGDVLSGGVDNLIFIGRHNALCNNRRR